MPKHEKNSPKAIANRIKSKGLQKLRWYCQMCQKQCRDQNGFKCHLMSESHQRQLLLFGENSNSYLNEFSETFKKMFLDILRRQFGTKRVRANQVYQEYIKEKDHVHMNSTTWHTLTGFIHYMGRAGIAKIDHTEKGWYIQYIDKEEEERREKHEKKKQMDKDDEERIQEFVTKQAEKAREQAIKNGDLEEKEMQEFQRTEGEKIGFTFPNTGRKAVKEEEPDDYADADKPSCSNAETDDRDPEDKPKGLLKRAISNSAAAAFSSSSSSKKIKSEDHTKKQGNPNKSQDSSSSKSGKNRFAGLDELREMEEKRKEMRNRKDYWLKKGIIVKIITKKLGDDFYKKKAVVEEVIDKYGAYVRVIGSDSTVKLDQTHVETVIPNLGKPVLIVNGAYRGLRAIMKDVNPDDFCVSVQIDEGPTRGRIVNKVPYEDICKFQPGEENS